MENTTQGNKHLYQYLAMLSGTLSIVCSGFHYGWPSPSLPKLLGKDSPIPITNDEGSWIAVMPLLGVLLGSPAGGIVSDLVGRKRAILLSTLPFFASWMMIAHAKSVAVLMTARFVAGVSDGLVICSLPMYLGEIADSKVRGKLGTSASMMWICGIFSVNAIGSYLSIRATALISSAIPILCLVTFVWFPESPYYLIMKGRTGQARKSLRTFRRSADVEMELNRMEKSFEVEHDNVGRLADLFVVKSNRRALFIAFGVRGVQQLSGSTAVTFYAQIIFEEAGNLNVMSPRDASILYFGVQLTLCLFCFMIIDRVGRRPLLITSIIGAAITLFVLGSYFCAVNVFQVDTSGFAWIPLVSLICFVIVFSLGMQTIPLLLLGELFPTSVKGFALIIADLYFSALATIVSKFFQITKDSFGLHVPFLVFCGFCVCGLVFIICCVPETKGKTLEQIQEELAQR